MPAFLQIIDGWLYTYAELILNVFSYPLGYTQIKWGIVKIEAAAVDIPGLLIPTWSELHTKTVPIIQLNDAFNYTGTASWISTYVKRHIFSLKYRHMVKNSKSQTQTTITLMTSHGHVVTHTLFPPTES